MTKLWYTELKEKGYDSEYKMFSMRKSPVFTSLYYYIKFGPPE